ncbi:DNA adenine methylase [Massilia timonae]|uniref:DNA adenine methylase n=1 Tax=Massilia timonae TaxID=47229 RepID=UPI00289B9C1E|nr:DNA adenine methylase [Massilia timonae]
MEAFVGEGTVQTSQSLPGNADQDVNILPRNYPQVIKYMGSKAGILDFLSKGLAEVHAEDRPLVDLFAGACAISGGFGHATQIISNDIQGYSAVIASTYLRRAELIGNFDIIALAQPIVDCVLASLPENLAYPKEAVNLNAFNIIERRNRKMIRKEFDSSHHLFTKIYSGTWWSTEQCVWIDAIREVLDTLKNRGSIEQADFDFGLTCLLSAMAYTSQGTGHYAQYRDANTSEGMLDILKYRRASVPALFNRRFGALLEWHLENVVDRGSSLLSLDYRECLAGVKNAVVYADPPYAFVHYSRFYHAMETLVRYDYPQIQHIGGKIVKGRYRLERHQSPFCIKTKVRGAFSEMFEGVKASKSDMLLSYSNTGMIDIQVLIDLARSHFGDEYKVWVEAMEHTHSTMGRIKDKSRQVKESLIIAKKLESVVR